MGTMTISPKNRRLVSAEESVTTSSDTETTQKEVKNNIRINKNYLYKSSTEELIKIRDWALSAESRTSWASEPAKKYAALIELTDYIIEERLFGGAQ
jgi:hypothetical protein